MPRHALVVAAVLATAPSAYAQSQRQPPPDPAPPAPAPAPTPAPSTPPAPPPPAGGQPPPQYYVDPGDQPQQQPPRRSAPPPGQQPVYEPPPPGYGYGPVLVYEPPPPPQPRHVAPKTALWLGARAGYFVPFGNLLFTCTGIDARFGDCVAGDYTSLSRYVSAGPMFELDGGLRFTRNYNVLFTWEHASLGPGTAESDLNGGQQNGSTDYYALALRVSSNPDKVGFLTEIALGFRTLRARWQDGRELVGHGGPFELRIGLGADIRLGPAFALSPELMLGAGAFGELEETLPDGTKRSFFGDLDEAAVHGWLAFVLGAHFDIGGSR